MNIPIFFSYPRPHTQHQQDFVDALKSYLENRGLMPRTLGITDYDTDAPLKAIRRLMLESYGLVTIALQRTKVVQGCDRAGADLPHQKERPIKEKWLTSPFCQIEPSMAYQLGLLILVFRQTGVIAQGVLEKGVVGLYMPSFSVRASNAQTYLKSQECRELIHKWEGQVRKVVDVRGNPPQLY